MGIAPQRFSSLPIQLAKDAKVAAPRTTHLTNSFELRETNGGWPYRQRWAPDRFGESLRLSTPPFYLIPLTNARKLTYCGSHECDT